MADASHRLVRWFGWGALFLYSDPIAYDRWRWLRGVLRSGPLRTLDAGCGSGVFTLAAARRGNRALGVTFDPVQVGVGRRCAALLRLPAAEFQSFDLRTLAEHDLGRAGFDQIICCEVIEHVMDDARLVRELAALLKPGGRLFLTTPSHDHPPLRGERVSETEDGGHVRWGYSHARLRELLAAAGLAVEREDFVGGRASQALTNLYRRGSGRWPRLMPALTHVLRRLCPFDHALTAARGAPFHCVAVVARREGAP